MVRFCRGSDCIATRLYTQETLKTFSFPVGLYRTMLMIWQLLYPEINGMNTQEYSFKCEAYSPLSGCQYLLKCSTGCHEWIWKKLALRHCGTNSLHDKAGV